MGQFKKCIQSQYIYIICTLSNLESKSLDKKISQICKDKGLIQTLDDEMVNKSNSSQKKDNKGYKFENEHIICRDIMSMDMKNQIQNKTDLDNYIVIPLNVLNITSLGILFVLILFGSYYVWIICTRKRCSCKVCKRDYKIVERLGEGGFGEIYKVRKGSEYFILKSCKTENITEADDILIEAKYHRNLDHKNIVKYYDDFIHIETNKGKIEPTYYVYIIMEFCEGGDLKQLIDLVYYKQNKFSAKEIFEIFIQICEGLNYLHNRNIIHRDIKSQNIFLTKNNIVRIGDFGLAKKLKKNKRVMSYMTKVGTDCYMAPEVMQGETYGKSADVWSLGCVMHEVCTLSFMWMHDTTIGLASLTQKDFVECFLAQINNEDYSYVVDLLKNIFVTSKKFDLKN